MLKLKDIEEVKGVDLQIGDWIIFDPDALFFKAFYIVIERENDSYTAIDCRKKFPIRAIVEFDKTVWKCNVSDDVKEKSINRKG